MNLLKILLTILFISFYSTVSMANVHFKFTHVASAEKADSPAPTLFVSVLKENGAHWARTRQNLEPGSSAEDYIRPSIFANDITGTYDVIVKCYGEGTEDENAFTAKLKILPSYDNNTILIEASCPMHAFKTNESNTSLSDVFITLPAGLRQPLSNSADSDSSNGYR